MNTAEVAIEHVIAGLLAICAFILPFMPEDVFARIDTKEVVGVMGLAYLVGVVFDRVADTFLASRETYLRLNVARRHIEKTGQSEGDPFPQDKQEYFLRMKDDGRVAWMNSLRSRIRTARELAVLGLPAGLGVFTYFSTERGTGAWFIGANAVVAVVAVLVAKVSDEDYRTDHYFTHARRQLVKEEKECLRDARRWRERRSIPLYLLWGVSLIGMLTLARIVWYSVLWVYAAGMAVVMVILAHWTWERVNKTYLGFVSRTDTEGKRKD